jgi:hypothetical protein
MGLPEIDTVVRLFFAEAQIAGLAARAALVGRLPEG